MTLNLQKKLLLSFTFLLVLLVGIMAMYHFAIQNLLQSYDQLTQEEIEIEKRSLMVKTSMLQCRRNEKNFLLRKDPKYLKRLEGNAQILGEHAAEIARIAQVIGADEIYQLASSIQKHGKEYVVSFNTVVQSYVDKGLDHKSGLQGDFRKAAHALSTLLKKMDTARINKEYLLLRRWEKDYQRTGVDKYKERLYASIKNIATSTNESSCDQLFKDSILSSLENYRQASLKFHTVMEDTTIDTSYEQARASAHGIESIIKKSDLDNLYKEYLLLRRWEKDYLRTHADKYKQRLMASITHLETIINASEIEQTYKNSAFEHLQNYNAASKKIIRSVEEALAEKHYQVIRNNAHTMEQLIQENNVLEGGETLLAIRKHEKNYLLRGGDKYIAAVQNIAKKLNTAIQASRVSADTKKTGALLVNNYLESFSQLVNASAASTDAISQMREMAHNIEKEIGEISQINASGEVITATQDSAHNVQFWALITGASLAIIGAGLATLLVRSITTPLKKTIENLTTNAQNVSDVSITLRSSSHSLANGATQQAASLEESSAALEELAAQAQSNAQSAHATSEMAQSIQADSTSGSQAIAELSESMQQIKSSTDKTAGIIKTIDEIAFQTNLLALNAAVEAARAGDAGRGFAVVAEEVRSLAQRCSVSANETTALVEEVRENVGNGESIAERVENTLQTIIHSIGIVNTKVNEVALGSREQDEGIRQLRSAVEGINEVTQVNVSKAEEASMVSQHLSQQSDLLNNAILDLKTIVESTNTSRTTTPTTEAIDENIISGYLK